jgi:glucose-1-phosphate cytidylyltransferase
MFLGAGRPATGGETVQVVILCGGQGARIRDVAEGLPKPMIPIGGRPILWHIMKSYADFGFTRFVLCLGYQSWAIKRYFLDYHLAEADFAVALGEPGAVTVLDAKPENWDVVLAETGLSSMTGCRVKRIERYIDGDSFFLTYGDGLANVDFRQLLAFHRRHGKLGTVTAVRPPSRFGEIEVRGGRVSEFNEKPLLSRRYVNGGFFVFQRGFFDRLRDDPGLVLEQGPLMSLAQDGELMAFPHDGFWQPMDNARDYKYLNELWEKQPPPWHFSPAVRRAAGGGPCAHCLAEGRSLPV